MAFKILNRDFSHTPESFSKESITPSLCDIVCDTVDELPTAEDIARENIMSGSWCWIVEANTYAVLSLAGVWNYEVQ